MKWRALPSTRPVCNDAEFNGDKTHRIWLSRRVAETGPLGLFIGVNPSKAGATDDDQTIRKEIGFASRWGWQGLWKGNLLSVIETDSSLLVKREPASLCLPEAAVSLEMMIRAVDVIVVCWGEAGYGQGSLRPALNRRRGAVLDLLATCRRDSCEVWCLGYTGSRMPLHTLRLPYAAQRQVFDPRKAV